MAIILNIDTATEAASVAISINGHVKNLKENGVQKEHASFLHLAINEVLEAENMQARDLDAVAITSGPGSYTGLRVAMAAAKGICYALKKPLIAVNTLLVMAQSAKQHITSLGLSNSAEAFICPMIDARRMEVFLAVYNMRLEEVEQTAPVVITEEWLEKFNSRPTYLVGSGANKLNVEHLNMLTILNVRHTCQHLGIIAEDYFNEKRFSDIVYLEPQYFKTFYTGV